MNENLVKVLEPLFESYEYSCEVVVYSGIHSSWIQNLNQGGRTSTPNESEDSFIDVALVSNVNECQEACKRKPSHIVSTNTISLDLFTYRLVSTQDSVNHYERIHKEVRTAIVRAVFSSNGSLCDSIDTTQDPADLVSFLFTDRPDLVSSKCKSTVIFIPNNFSRPQVAAKHVKWQTHWYLPTQDVILWVDGFMSPHIKYPWKTYLQDLYNFSINPAHTNDFMISTRKQFMKRLNVQTENDECFRCKRITKEMHSLANKYLTQENVTKDRTQIYWTSIVVKANRHKQTRLLSETLFDLLQNFHQRDQVFLPVILEKYKSKVFAILPESCDKVLGHHNVEVKI